MAEDEVTTSNRIRLLQNCQDLRAHWQDMLETVFRPLWWEGDFCADEIDLVPLQIRNFITALPGENKKLNNFAVVASRTGVPNVGKFNEA